MVKHTQTICPQKPNVFHNFVGLALKRLTSPCIHHFEEECCDLYSLHNKIKMQLFYRFFKPKHPSKAFLSKPNTSLLPEISRFADSSKGSLYFLTT